MHTKNIVVSLPKTDSKNTALKCRIPVPELLGSSPEQIRQAEAVRMQLLTEAGTALRNCYAALPEDRLQSILNAYQADSLQKLITLLLTTQQRYLLSLFYAGDLLLAADDLRQMNQAHAQALQFAASSRPLSEW